MVMKATLQSEIRDLLSAWRNVKEASPTQIMYFDARGIKIKKKKHVVTVLRCQEMQLSLLQGTWW
jgi:predicted phosphatase